MNPHKQRAAIAEYCGWKLDKTQYKQWISPNGTSWNYPPQYDKDLNQTHEAEKVLRAQSADFWRGYWTNLVEVLLPSKEYWCATAAQRAEAFLKTIGKWEE